MKLLSIDVGIKNLAYCLLDNGEIILWDVINLCGPLQSCEQCYKEAKYVLSFTGTTFCTIHAKKSSYLLPNTNLSLKKIKKMKMSDLHKVVEDHQIELPPNVKKDELLKTVLTYMEQQMLQPVSHVAANDFDLVKLGISMRKAFDHDLKQHLTSIDCIIIENQISPIANRMKTLQGMIAQYFIMHEKTDIKFVSAANKLKGASPLTPSLTKEASPLTPPLSEKNEQLVPAVTIEEPTQPGGSGGLTPKGGPGVSPPSYADRKKAGIKITLDYLQQPQYIQWQPHFKQHKKKDDLADAFLQGKWYCNKIDLNV
jgi:hypothetical protein